MTRERSPWATPLALAAIALALAPGRAAAKKAGSVSEVAGYLSEMERLGLVDKGLGTPERLAAAVAAADQELVAGRTALAAARLYAIVEGPRWQDLSESEDFQDAEYRLGLALHRGGGGQAARRYLARALARGPKAPFFEAALRTYVDVCLDDHLAGGCWGQLLGLGADAPQQLPPSASGELAYLRGRAAFDAGDGREAETQLERVTPESRFYSSALYLRGLLRVHRRDFPGAQDAFCAVVGDPKDPGTLRFFIDRRYHHVRDLARLALGRVDHEQGQYEDAFYHYFLVPSDSEKLPDALFESAWSSLERHEFDLGARLIDEFLKSFPRSPRAFEGRLLKATLEVKTCRFHDAEAGFDVFIAAYQPLLREIDRAVVDAELRGALGARLLHQDRTKGPLAPGDVEGRIAELLQVDARFFQLEAIARGLAGEALDAGHVEAAWQALAARIGGSRVQTASANPATLLRGTDEMGQEIRRARAELRRRAGSNGAQSLELERTLDALEERRRGLKANLVRASEIEAEPQTGASGLGPKVAADLEHARALKTRIARLTARLDSASGELVREALVDLRGRAEEMLRRARLGKIDAVVGEKRKLERQIEDLAAGRFPPELFGRLHIEGLIGDDEEYWPPEAERWADEYENYR